MANENLVKFRTGTYAEYTALETKDENTLYFLTDIHKIYKGDVPFGGGSYEAVESFPETGTIGTIYINTATGEVKYWNGADYVQVVKPYRTAIRKTGATDEFIVTEKAVADYLATKLADLDVGEIEGRVTALETAVADVYTKGEADTKIATAVANAAHLKREIVDELPEVEAGDDNTIYMVPIEDGEGNQKYEEFFLVNGEFEKIGDSAVDLTNYVTDTMLETAATDLKTELESTIESTASSTLQDAKDYADGKLEASDITTGSTDGTIAVDGTDVNVAGLKSAAYTESSAYDSAGAATSALSDAKDYTDNALAWKDIAE